jgi:hypothetical protein
MQSTWERTESEEIIVYTKFERYHWFDESFSLLRDLWSVASCNAIKVKGCRGPTAAQFKMSLINKRTFLFKRKWLLLHGK